MRKSERVRVNMRLPADLVRWAKKQSQAGGVTFTEFVEKRLAEARVQAQWHSREIIAVEDALRRETSDARVAVAR